MHACVVSLTPVAGHPALQIAAEHPRTNPKKKTTTLTAGVCRSAGEVRSEERMEGLIRWCVRHRIHLVVDEVFALSVFPSSAPFRSAMAVAADVAASLPHAQAERLWEHVHVIYGLSKDFCMSGAPRTLRAVLRSTPRALPPLTVMRGQTTLGENDCAARSVLCAVEYAGLCRNKNGWGVCR